MAGALELTQVSKVYEVGGSQVVALAEIDLVVADREVVTLLGPSGSGKTTLLSIAGGLLTPSTGRVVVGGQDITHASARKLTRFRRRHVGFIFQAVNLVPFLTARENLLVVAELTRRDRRKATRRADALLEGLGLSHRVDNLPGQLSGGERQRVAIGRALMNEPTLVLVDEPTSALDSQLGEQVMELIVSEVKARDAAAVIVTHDQRMTRYGDRILTMADGHIASIQPRPEWTTLRADHYEPELELIEDDVGAGAAAEAVDAWPTDGGAVAHLADPYARRAAGAGGPSAGGVGGGRDVGGPGRAGGVSGAGDRGRGQGAGGAAAGRGVPGVGGVTTGLGTRAGLYGGRAGRAAAGWGGFPPPSSRTASGSQGGPDDTNIRRPEPVARSGGLSADRGAGRGAGTTGGGRRPGARPVETTPTTAGAGAGVSSSRTDRVSTDRGESSEEMEGFFGPERRGRRWRRPEGGTAAGRSRGTGSGRTGRAGQAGAGAGSTDEWGQFDDPSISPPGGTRQVDTGWDHAGTQAAWTGEQWGDDDTDEQVLEGADERLDRSRLEEPPETERWRRASWPPSRSQPVVDAGPGAGASPGRRPIDVDPIEVRTGDMSRVDPVDVAREAIYQARTRENQAVRPRSSRGAPPTVDVDPVDRSSRTPRRPDRPSRAPSPSARPGRQPASPPPSARPSRQPGSPPPSARPSRQPGSPSPSGRPGRPPGASPPRGSGADAGAAPASPWAPAPAGQLGNLPQVPSSDDEATPPRKRRRKP
jgi:putative ABC transport system ATP-binding protein